MILIRAWPNGTRFSIASTARSRSNRNSMGTPLWRDRLSAVREQSSALDGTRPSAQTVGMSSGYAQKILFFYCHKCKQYEEKTSPHYRAQKQRFARRRKKEAAQTGQSEQHA